MQHASLMLGLCLLLSGNVAADKPPKPDGMSPGLAKHGGVPPGLAKKGGLPPGLAKKFGRNPPPHPYIAFEPGRVDRAWFLIDGRWILKQGFDAQVQVEVRQAVALPPVPPPVPLPSVGFALTVVLFD